MKPINAKKMMKAYADKDEEAIKVEIAPLEKAIKEAEGRATMRTIQAKAILSVLMDIDDRFAFASKKSREGLTINVDYHAHDFPNAYKYRPESTHFTAEYKNGSWRITGIFRDWCRRSGNEYLITMPDQLKEALIAHYSTAYYL